MEVYRGTQRKDPGGVRRGMSFAYSLPVAVIWSARPGDPWARRPTEFLPTSTVHTATIKDARILDLGGNYNTLGEIVTALDYGKPGGITDDEVRRIFNYMHNRITGKAKGGEYAYRIIDEDGEPQELDLGGVFSGRTLILEARDDWDWDQDPEIFDRITADTYIFADAPAVQKAAKRLGYDALVYWDAFVGGTVASEDLFDEEIDDLEGIEMDYDLEDEYIPMHRTLRIIEPQVIERMESAPAGELQ